MEQIGLKNGGISDQAIANHNPTDPHSPPPAESKDSGELRSLLGGLVAPLLRDENGDLDLSKIPTENFETFREFLITQVKNDGIAFNEHLLASYHKVLAKEEYRPLLEGLLGKRGRGEGHNILLQKFTAEIVAVSAQKFVSSNIQSDSGRQRIRSILSNKEAYTKEIRADVAKAIAQNGYEMGTLTSTFLDFNHQIAVLNYANLGISDEEMNRGSELADKVLQQVEEIAGKAKDIQEKYSSNAKEVTRFPGLERELNRKIRDEEIQAKAKLLDLGAKDTDPVVQLRGKLAQFWLLVVDDGHWRESNPYKTATNAAFLLKETERLLQEGETVGTQEKLLEWSEQIRNFLSGGLHVTGEGVGRDLKDFFAPTTVKDMMGPIPQAHRSPYDELKQFVDEIHFSADMGDRLLIGRKAGHDELTEVRSKFLQGLQQAKQSLWYSYKQHRALSRGVSFVASWFGGGDIASIKEGEQALDQLIAQVESATDPSQIQVAVQQLQKELSENGRLQGAMRDAEMEGMEQILGLGQSILILLASRGLLQFAGNISPIATQITQLAAGDTLAWRAGKAFGLGFYLSGAENAVAVASGEVRPDGENFSNWFKDSLSTGISMMATAPFASFLGKHPTTPSVTGRVITRYFRSGLHGITHFAADTALETAEEYIDASVRAKLDDGNAWIGKDQAREIAAVTMTGGGLGAAKMGTVAEILKPLGNTHKNTTEKPQIKYNPPPPPPHLAEVMKPVVATQLQESPAPAPETKPEETIEPYPIVPAGPEDANIAPDSKAPASFKVELDELDQQYLEGLEKRDYVKKLLEHPVLHPSTKVQTGNYVFFFSPVVQEKQANGEQRLHAFAVVPVEREGKVILKRRWFYKSQSGGNWRASPYKAWSHYVKGVGIHYTAETQPTLEIQRHLNYLEKQVESFPEITGSDVDLFVDAASPIISERGKKTMLAGFGEEIEKKSVIGISQIGTHKPGQLGQKNAGGWAYAEDIQNLPETLISLPYPEGFIPDFAQTPLRVMEDSHSLLGPITLREYGGSVLQEKDGTNKLQQVPWMMREYRGTMLQEKTGGNKLRQVRWTMAEDGQGRVWIQQIRFADSEPNSYGVYQEVIDSGVLTSKPLEYHQQSYGIKAEYKKNFNNQYADISPLLSLLLPIRNYRQARGLPVKLLTPHGFSQGFIQNGNQHHFFLDPKTIYLVLGRNFQGALGGFINHPSVDINHAQITAKIKLDIPLVGAPKEYFIEDLGSANGTFVNGARLKPRQVTPIKPGDKIWLGAVNFIFGGHNPGPLTGGLAQNL